MSNLENDGVTSSMEIVDKTEYDNKTAKVTMLLLAVEIATKALRRICGDIPMDEDYSSHAEDIRTAAKALTEMAAALAGVASAEPIRTIDANGTIEYKLNDKHHRLDGPAIEFADGTKSWLVEGKYHRLDGPAIEYASGTKWWYVEGKELTEEEFEKLSSQPVRTADARGTILYKLNGQLHRLDGPAAEYADGSKFWYVEGKLHRLDGPAAECASGTKQWYVEGKCHRLDGPAIEYASGTKWWYVEGKWLTEKQFKALTAV